MFILFLKRTKFSKGSAKQKYFQSQTSVHHDKQQGLFRSVENVTLTNILQTADGTDAVLCVVDGVPCR